MYEVGALFSEFWQTRGKTNLQTGVRQGQFQLFALCLFMDVHAAVLRFSFTRRGWNTANFRNTRHFVRIISSRWGFLTFCSTLLLLILYFKIPNFVFLFPCVRLIAVPKIGFHTPIREVQSKYFLWGLLHALRP